MANKPFAIQGSDLTLGGVNLSAGPTGIIIPVNIKSNGNINIEINLADSTLRRWQFGEDGILTAPGAVDAPSIITNLINSADSSAITFTPTVRFDGAIVVGGGTINNAVIGGITPEVGTFTTLTATDQIYQNNLSVLGISLIMS